MYHNIEYFKSMPVEIIHNILLQDNLCDLLKLRQLGKFYKEQIDLLLAGNYELIKQFNPNILMNIPIKCLLNTLNIKQILYMIIHPNHVIPDKNIDFIDFPRIEKDFGTIKYTINGQTKYQNIYFKYESTAYSKTITFMNSIKDIYSLLPAKIIYNNKNQIIYQSYIINGKMHNNKAPALIEYSTDKTIQSYYMHGYLHNNIGPAQIINENNGQVKLIYALHGRIYNKNKPAEITYYANGTIKKVVYMFKFNNDNKMNNNKMNNNKMNKEYYKARCNPNLSIEYYENGQIKKYMHNYNHDNNYYNDYNVNDHYNINTINHDTTINHNNTINHKNMMVCALCKLPFANEYKYNKHDGQCHISFYENGRLAGQEYIVNACSIHISYNHYNPYDIEFFNKKGNSIFTYFLNRKSINITYITNTMKYTNYEDDMNDYSETCGNFICETPSSCRYIYDKDQNVIATISPDDLIGHTFYIKDMDKCRIGKITANYSTTYDRNYNYDDSCNNYDGFYSQIAKYYDYFGNNIYQ